MEKKTRTFATTDALWEKARRKAHREGTTVSEKIHGWLKQYVKPVKKEAPVKVNIDLSNDY